MDDKNFYDLLNEDVPMNHNIQKYMMVTRNKLREYGRIAVSYSAGSDSDIMLDMIELVKPYEDCGEISGSWTSKSKGITNSSLQGK